MGMSDVISRDNGRGGSFVGSPFSAWNMHVFLCRANARRSYGFVFILVNTGSYYIEIQVAE